MWSKYIGPVTGQDEMIGVELDSWSPEARDGRYDGHRYFSAPEGRGVLIHRRDIMDVIPLQHGLEISSVMAIRVELCPS